VTVEGKELIVAAFIGGIFGVLGYYLTRNIYDYLTKSGII